MKNSYTKLLKSSVLEQPEFLPMSRAELDILGWSELDILLVSGDAYIDHPTFAMAILGRWLVAHGFRVGLVCQPDWRKVDDLLVMGRPRLFVGISAGAMDSMLAHYTAFRKKRHDDAFTEGGRCGSRPNRATLVYAGLVRQAFAGLRVVIGGIEASMRRISHYDFWSDKLRRSLLLDSKADLLLYGMGERSLLEVAQRLEADINDSLFAIYGSAIVGNADLAGDSVLTLPSHEKILADKDKLMVSTLLLEQQVHNGGQWLVQESGGRSVVVAPPAVMLTTEELDFLYGLPFKRLAHPSYKDNIPALGMIQTSITSHRGCAGGCSFCTLAIHQGRRIRSRSEMSIKAEATNLLKQPFFRGSISDVGGPSANMWQGECTLQKGECKRSSCLHPTICKYFKVDQSAGARMLLGIKKLSGVKHLRIASGVRFDLALQDLSYSSTFIHEFVGGQLKIAPEHICDSVLKLMRKPSVGVFEKFLELFQAESSLAGKEQYVIPYLMSAFPGCGEKEMRQLADWLHKRNWQPQQIQCFIPTPGSVATASFYCGKDAEGNKIYVATSDAERLKLHYILAPKMQVKTGKHKSFKTNKRNFAKTKRIKQRKRR